MSLPVAARLPTAGLMPAAAHAFCEGRADRDAPIPIVTCRIDAALFWCKLLNMMKEITVSVEDAVLQQARRRAAAENTTINELVHAWLERYVAQPGAADQYLELMESLRHVEAGRKYTREEMNERR